MGFRDTDLHTYQAQPPPLRTRHPLVTTQNIYFLARMEAGVRWERGRTGLCRPGADTPPASSPPTADPFSPQCSRPRVPAATPLYGVAGACPPSSAEGAGRGLRVEEDDVPQWRLPIPRREQRPGLPTVQNQLSLSLFSRSPSPRRGGYLLAHMTDGPRRGGLLCTCCLGQNHGPSSRGACGVGVGPGGGGRRGILHGGERRAIFASRRATPEGG